MDNELNIYWKETDNYRRVMDDGTVFLAKSLSPETPLRVSHEIVLAPDGHGSMVPSECICVEGPAGEMEVGYIEPTPVPEGIIDVLERLVGIAPLEPEKARMPEKARELIDLLQKKVGVHNLQGNI